MRRDSSHRQRITGGGAAAYAVIYCGCFEERRLASSLSPASRLRVILISDPRSGCLLSHWMAAGHRRVRRSGAAAAPALPLSLSLSRFLSIGYEAKRRQERERDSEKASYVTPPAPSLLLLMRVDCCSCIPALLLLPCLPVSPTARCPLVDRRTRCERQTTRQERTLRPEEPEVIRMQDGWRR